MRIILMCLGVLVCTVVSFFDTSALGAPRIRTQVSSGPVTDLDLPRFVALRADEVNARTGPGFRYPIKFRFQRAHMPVEVIDEFEYWRKIRDWQGEEGWVHRRLLTSMRYLRVQEDRTALRMQPEAAALPRAWLQDGVIAKIKRCDPRWCKVEIESFTGWLDVMRVYGTYANETLTP